VARFTDWIRRYRVSSQPLAVASWMDFASDGSSKRRLIRSRR
jgi:hypothetical protein